MIGLLRSLWCLARATVPYMADAPNRWILDAHAPMYLSTRGEAVCWAHSRLVDWPCREWSEAYERHEIWAARWDKPLDAG